MVLATTNEQSSTNCRMTLKLVFLCCFVNLHSSYRYLYKWWVKLDQMSAGELPGSPNSPLCSVNMFEPTVRGSFGTRGLLRAERMEAPLAAPRSLPCCAPIPPPPPAPPPLPHCPCQPLIE